MMPSVKEEIKKSVESALNQPDDRDVGLQFYMNQNLNKSSASIVNITTTDV